MNRHPTGLRPATPAQALLASTRLSHTLAGYRFAGSKSPAPKSDFASRIKLILAHPLIPSK